ncbi:uncharacterized protein EV422DRAFT_414311 [Fimicolochytrium jonesii]|uniref:uncharacterized protein n=1 Tax=Fimicolochytrium jonesii TaxID=1396493 RepID=UPI0022FDF1AF|nr:uncharacterized protein EV422DRAFT_414311 [Fimicolochytrium jonesii]KAI8822037.1 hypothetical protein EV422DRAFT_414311 [Fimicolochytrium jonesii]
MPKDLPLVEYTKTRITGTDDTEYVVTWKQSGETVRVRTGDSKYHGKGLFCAQERIPEGSYLDHYHGRTMSSLKAHKDYPENDDSFYTKYGTVVVPFNTNPGRFINDSVKLPESEDGELEYLEPHNASFVDREEAVYVVATKDILQDEEIIIDYGREYWNAKLLEHAGFEDIPPRLEFVTNAKDARTKKCWAKAMGRSELPDDVRLIKIRRGKVETKRKVYDYYLLKKGVMGVWRSGKQYAVHLEHERVNAFAESPAPCPCETCLKKRGGVKRKLARAEDDDDVSTAPPTNIPPPAKRARPRRGVIESDCSTPDVELPVSSTSSVREDSSREDETEPLPLPLSNPISPRLQTINLHGSVSTSTTSNKSNTLQIEARQEVVTTQDKENHHTTYAEGLSCTIIIGDE